MILGILFIPKIRVGKLYLDSCWLVTILGLLVMLLCGYGKFDNIVEKLTQNTAINPLKILVLFISMTIISIFLDELGFFKALASFTLGKAKTSQFKLFLLLYITVSILTVFTSNDIIILSLTPFICYFSKNGKINPLPYLGAEFVGANTWSMMLIIGNPTNIYLSTSFGIDFISYLKVMAIPTILSGIVAFLLLLLLFRKQLLMPISNALDGEFMTEKHVKNKPLLILGLIILSTCTVILGVSNYVNAEMWLISFMGVVALCVCALIYSLIKRRKPTELLTSVKRAPWQLIPFVLSMFSIIIILAEYDVTQKIANLLGNDNLIIKYGVTSFLTANVINNIPMSVLYSNIIGSASWINVNYAVYSTIIGSNLGAIFTPIGALAGIMFTSLLSHQHVKYGYLDFLKIGIVVPLPTLFVSLFSLMLFV